VKEKMKSGIRIMNAQDLIRQRDKQDLEQFLSELTPESWQSAKFLTVPIGLLASYEFLLTRKLQDTRFEPAEWNDFMPYIRSVGFTAILANTVKQQFSPDVVLVYDSLYGSNRVWTYLGKSLNWDTYAIQNITSEADGLLDLRIYNDDDKQFQIASSPESKHQLATPISPSAIEAVSRRHISKLDAKSVTTYSKPHEGSSPADIRNKFSLRSSQPVILLVLSSNDERFAARILGIKAFCRRPTVFADQLEWIRATCVLAESRPDLQFVVRIHPRMFKNDRESVVAKGSAGIVDLLRDSPENVKLNQPSDGVSLTDLFQITDVCLPGTSSVGSQAAAMGIPLVIHDPDLVFAYPTALGFLVEDQKSYESMLDLALEKGWSLQQVRQAFRFMHFMDSVVTLSLFSNITLNKDNLNNVARSGFLKSKFARHLPFVLKQSWRNHADADLVAKNIKLLHNNFEKRNAYPFEKVLCNRLDGLHQVIAIEDKHEVEQETDALRVALRDLVMKLGSFPEESDCLSSRIERYLGSSVS